ncbi:hypothetical protein [Leyella stercorea]|nr:hypothetical protein [Leyella stercorea]
MVTIVHLSTPQHLTISPPQHGNLTTSTPHHHNISHHLNTSTPQQHHKP